MFRFIEGSCGVHHSSQLLVSAARRNALESEQLVGILIWQYLTQTLELFQSRPKSPLLSAIPQPSRHPSTQLPSLNPAVIPQPIHYLSTQPSPPPSAHSKRPHNPIKARIFILIPPRWIRNLRRHRALPVLPEIHRRLCRVPRPSRDGPRGPLERDARLDRVVALPCRDVVTLAVGFRVAVEAPLEVAGLFSLASGEGSAGC